MYDVVIVGAGPAGLFAAYELVSKNKNLKIRRLFVRSLYNHEFYLHRKSPADTPPTYEDRSDSYLSVPSAYYQTDEKLPSDEKHFPHKPFPTQT